MKGAWFAVGTHQRGGQGAPIKVSVTGRQGGPINVSVPGGQGGLAHVLLHKGIQLLLVPVNLFRFDLSENTS